jgi:hypothetical protein
MKEVIVQDLKQPMKMLKSADSGGPRRLSVWNLAVQLYSDTEIVKVSERLTSNWILRHDNVPDHYELSVKEFLIQKSITENEHPPCYTDLVPNDFWLFTNVVRLKGRNISGYSSIPPKNLTSLKVIPQQEYKKYFE